MHKRGKRGGGVGDWLWDVNFCVWDVNYFEVLRFGTLFLKKKVLLCQMSIWAAGCKKFLCLF